MVAGNNCRYALYLLCIYILLALCIVGHSWTHKERNKVTISMSTKCNHIITVPDDIDDLHIRYLSFSMPTFSITKCQLYIKSRAFKFVDQSVVLKVPKGIMGRNCITIGKPDNHGRVSSTDGKSAKVVNMREWVKPRNVGNMEPVTYAPIKLCKNSYIRDVYEYSSPDIFTVKVERDHFLSFTIDMNMHKRANDWKPFVTDISRKMDVNVPVLDVNMKAYCGKGLTISRGAKPIHIHYQQQHFGEANCTITIHNRNTPFNELALQVFEYEELNGFCIMTEHIGANQGMTFCDDSPPNVHRIYTSQPQQRDFEITVTGSGSAFMSFRLLLHTFHQGECYDRSCGNNRCVPTAYECKHVYPCDDYKCPEGGQKLSVYLIIFCSVFTAFIALPEFCCCVRSDDMLRSDAGIGLRQQTVTQQVSESSAQARHEPSAPMLDTVSAPVVTSTPPESDLPPPYDEVVAHPDKYGGSDS